jgi:hypothetical protein
MILNPKRRRRRGHTTRRRSSARRALVVRHSTHHRRRRHRNPGFGGLARGGKFLGLPLMEAVTIGVGALATRAGGNLLAKLPVPEFPGKKYVLQGAAAVAGSMLVRKFAGPKWGNAVATGGAVSIVLGLVGDYVAPHVPLLSDYVTEAGGTVSAYLPAPAFGMSGGTGQWDSGF